MTLMPETTPKSNRENNDVEAVENIGKAKAAILSEVQKRIFGQQNVIEHLLIALFSRGHCLMMGVPGLAKTLLVSTLAEVLDLEFNRIQFTPDLMPSDITGTDILEEDVGTKKRFFKFIKGPVFCNLLLADEINRTPPKTQAALLQSMQEYQVTASGVTYTLALPFQVFATQNPIEQEGTYPLPEAQLDRFMFHVAVDYPTQDVELEIVRRTTGAEKPELKPVMGPEEIVALQELVLRVPVADRVIQYAVSLARASRPGSDIAPDLVNRYVGWGAGPRASQYLIWGSKARAVLEGRFAADIEDVRALAPPILRHRILTNFQAEAEKVSSDHLIEQLLDRIRP